MKVSKVYYALQCVSIGVLRRLEWLLTRFNMYVYADQVPVVIYELNESAINFISQESFEKALILL